MYKSIRMPEEFVKEVKEVADKEYRTVPQQIMYWAELGRQNELRKWQLQEMEEGLEQIKEGNVVSHEEVQNRIKQTLSQWQEKQ